MNAKYMAIAALTGLCIGIPDAQASGISSGGRIQITPLGGDANEPIMATTSRGLVVAYDPRQPTGPDGIFGFGTSTTGLTWTLCTAGLSCTVPHATGFASWTWTGNLGIASDGGTNVVIVALVDTNGDGKQDHVSVSLSTNGGVSFIDTKIVDDAGCTGLVDQPSVTWDTTVSPSKFWVVWRNNSLGTNGACLRSGSVTATAVNMIGTSTAVSGMNSETIGSGQGGVELEAGFGAVTVVYVNNENYNACPSTSNQSLGWYADTTFDGGASWQNNLILETPLFRSCVLDNDNTNGPPPAGQIQKNLRDFSFVMAPTSGIYYVAVNDAKGTIRLFESESQGRIWRERCSALTGQIPPTMFAPVGTGQVCSSPAFVAANVNSTLYYPTLAVDDAGRLASAFYESDASDTNFQFDFFANGGPSGPLATWTTVAPLQSPVGVTTVSPGGKFDSRRPFGDYIGMAALKSTGACTTPQSTFLPVWVTTTLDPASGPQDDVFLLTERETFTP